jgi:hypothetical protein
MAAKRYTADPTDESLAKYTDDGLGAIESGRYDAVPFDFASELGGIHIMRGEPERWLEMCRNMIAGAEGAHILPKVYLVITLAMIGNADEAMKASEDLRNAERVTDNPAFACFALLAYGYARHLTDPATAYEAHRLGAKIAQDTDNRLLETYHTGNLSRLAARHGDTADAFDFIAMSIRNYFDAGNYSLLPQPMAVLATFFESLGHYKPAATFSGFASTTFARNYFPEMEGAITRLREVLGDESYESLARTGKSMTSAAMANYALEQINLARGELS